MAIVSRLNALLTKHKKISIVLFFSLGFVWDWLTIGRIDSREEIAFLVLDFVCLSICMYLFYTHSSFKALEKYKPRLDKYLPIAIQFFLGGLTGAFFIFFSRSVSFSKTAFFFLIVVFIFISNEFFRKRISLRVQFIHYSFVSFLFFGCISPIIFSTLELYVFYIAGILSLMVTFLVTFLIVIRIEKERKQRFRKLWYFIALTHLLIALFFVLRLIPPVPLALTNGLVAHHIKKMDNSYKVVYKPKSWYNIWSAHESKLNFRTNDSVFVFTSIFSPNQLRKKIYHKWSYYNNDLKEWKMTDKIGYSIEGGRNSGFRGYTYKSRIMEGDWRVEVITEEDLIIGVLNFTIIFNDEKQLDQLKTKRF